MLVALVAKGAGANVMVSEVNENRIAKAKVLGQEVLNPMKEDLTAIIKDKTKGSMADVVFEVAGVQSAI